MPRTHLLVLAKAPQPGFVKTRLTPAYSPEEAAALAEAALCDTLDAGRACSAERRVLALAGEPGPWLGFGFEVVPQVDGSLNDRLAAAWAVVDGPGVQVGMDTPQVTPELLDDALRSVTRRGVDAVVGLATDGGWWAIGFRRGTPGAFSGVAMSRADTGVRQLARLRGLGLRVALLPELRDMDEPADVAAIARSAPRLAVARLARSLDRLPR